MSDKERITQRARGLSDPIESLSRYEIIGYMYGYACQCADRGIDIRQVELPAIVADLQSAQGEAEQRLADRLRAAREATP